MGGFGGDLGGEGGGLSTLIIRRSGLRKCTDCAHVVHTRARTSIWSTQMHGVFTSERVAWRMQIRGRGKMHIAFCVGEQIRKTQFSVVGRNWVNFGGGIAR